MQPPPDGPAATAPELDLPAARELLELHVRTTRWGRRDLAARLSVESFERTGAFDVIFASFVETRGTAWAHTPYLGGPVDGPENGAAPGPWDIPLQSPPPFTPEHRISVRVPHTESVKTCHVCSGSGRVTCGSCSGSGRVSCGFCSGSGSVSRTRTITETDSQGNTTTRTESYSEMCTSCSGSGRVTCSTCGGDGQVTCGACQGALRLRHFLELHVRWFTRTNSEQIEKTALPDELVGVAGGVVILHEDEGRIEAGRGGEDVGGPYRGMPVRVNADVEAAANRLIAGHVFPKGHLLHRQRLIVRAVPVYEARYRWGKETKSFWVYGTDRRVHAPGYPLSPWRVGGVALGSVAALAIPVTMGVMGTAPAPSTQPSYPEPPPPSFVATTPPIEMQAPPPLLPELPPLPPLATAEPASSALPGKPALRPLTSPSSTASAAPRRGSSRTPP